MKKVGPHTTYDPEDLPKLGEVRVDGEVVEEPGYPPEEQGCIESLLGLVFLFLALGIMLARGIL